MATKASDRAKITEKAEHFVKAGKIEDAVAEYQKLLDGSGQDISIANIIGDLCLQLGQEDRAVQLFRANVDTLERRGAYSQALAIAKKINKIKPADPVGMIRLGDLYGQLGFSSEAREEYGKAAEELEKRGETKPLIALYEKRAKIDRSDLVTRLRLAKLYLEDAKGEQAQVVLNDAVDLLYVRKDYGEAEKILNEALSISDGDIRTLGNMARVHRELQKPEATLALLEGVIKKRGARSDLLGLLAGMYAEQNQNDKAAEIYVRILKEDPGNHDIRAKAGLVEIRRNRLDKALEIFDPLVSQFLQRSDEDKAAGLLGLILMTGNMHLPTLERLAGVFRGVGRTRDLETTLRVLLAEYRSIGKDNDRIRILRELFMLLPMDPDILREAGEVGIKTDLRKASAEKSPGEGEPQTEEDREMIRLNLAKAELYLEQGLTRNARRIMENLRLLYPEDPRVRKKVAELENIPKLVMEESIPEIVEETVRKEIDIIGASARPAASAPLGAPIRPAAPPADAPPARPAKAAKEAKEGKDVKDVKPAKPVEPIAPAPAPALDLESLISDGAGRSAPVFSASGPASDPASGFSAPGPASGSGIRSGIRSGQSRGSVCAAAFSGARGQAASEKRHAGIFGPRRQKRSASRRGRQSRACGRVRGGARRRIHGHGRPDLCRLGPRPVRSFQGPTGGCFSGVYRHRRQDRGGDRSSRGRVLQTDQGTDFGHREGPGRNRPGIPPTGRDQARSEKF